MGRRSSSDSTDNTLDKPKLGLLRGGLQLLGRSFRIEAGTLRLQPWDADPNLTLSTEPGQAQAGPVAGRAALLGRSFRIEAGTLGLQPWDADPHLTVQTAP